MFNVVFNILPFTFIISIIMCTYARQVHSISFKLIDVPSMAMIFSSNVALSPSSALKSDTVKTCLDLGSEAIMSSSDLLYPPTCGHEQTRVRTVLIINCSFMCHIKSLFSCLQLYTMCQVTVRASFHVSNCL